LQPDVVAFNEICLPLQTGLWLQRMARERLGRPFALLQQSTVNGSSLVEGEALLTRYPMVETANWDYRTLDMVAQVVRLDIEGRLLSVFRPTQTAPTAFTPLQDTDGSVSHPYWDRFDRCIDDIWVAGPLTIRASGVCFNTPSATDFTLWPSDHAGVWADLVFI
jgi:endonuclease/exonuclease/phosphatase family metal-dependent hydrolase